MQFFDVFSFPFSFFKGKSNWENVICLKVFAGWLRVENNKMGQQKKSIYFRKKKTLKPCMYFKVSTWRPHFRILPVFAKNQ